MIEANGNDVDFQEGQSSADGVNAQGKTKTHIVPCVYSALRTYMSKTNTSSFFSQLATFAAPPAAASTAATPPATLSAALSMAAAAAVPSKFKTREREVFGRSHYWQTCLLVLFELCELK